MTYYMKMQDERAEGREEGRKEGRQEGRTEKNDCKTASDNVREGNNRKTELFS